MTSVRLVLDHLNLKRKLDFIQCRCSCIFDPRPGGWAMMFLVFKAPCKHSHKVYHYEAEFGTESADQTASCSAKLLTGATTTVVRDLAR